MREYLETQGITDALLKKKKIDEYFSSQKISEIPFIHLRSLLRADVALQAKRQAGLPNF